ncbi:hypothetical protein Dimus_005712, partial [Dionaea muscipula]
MEARLSGVPECLPPVDILAGCRRELPEWKKTEKWRGREQRANSFLPRVSAASENSDDLRNPVFNQSSITTRWTINVPD